MLRPALLVALDELRSHPLRSVLGAATIAIGAAAVVLVVSLGDAAGAALRDEVERVGGREATYRVESGSLSPPEAAEVAARLAHYGVPASRWRTTEALPAEHGTGVAVDPDYQHVRRIRVLAGRWLHDSDADQLMTPVVINEPVARRLGAPHELPGRRIDRVSVVVGVVDDGQQEAAYYLVGRESAPAEPTSVVFAAAPEAAIEVMLARDLGILFPERSISITRIDETESWYHLISLARAVLGAVAAATLLVGAIGLLNVGLSSVKERIRDIGIRRSFGARRRDVFASVLLESVIVASSASVLGVLLAVGLFAVTPQVAGVGVSVGLVSGEAVWAALATALMIGVLVGLTPAWRASRVRVIDAIRR